MRTILLKLVLVSVIFAVGYSLPNLLQFDKKMQFVTVTDQYQKVKCQLISQQCVTDEYRIELIEGNFTNAQKTVFNISRNDQPVMSEVLVTSDDNLFGTIVSQVSSNNPQNKQVLIPYCGNPIMRVIVIDKEKNKGLIITESPSS